MLRLSQAICVGERLCESHEANTMTNVVSQRKTDIETRECQSVDIRGSGNEASDGMEGNGRREGAGVTRK